MTFNEWMLHIYRELNYPPETLKKYEQCIKGIPQDQRGTNENRNRTQGRGGKNSRSLKADQRRAM